MNNAGNKKKDTAITHSDRSKNGSDYQKKTKTETITFRLPMNIIEELRKDAELENVSLNSLVSKIFANHIQWERYERKVGLLPMTKPFLKEVINQLSDEQITFLAQKIEKENFKNILVFIKDNHDIEDFIEILRSWLTVSWMQHNIDIRSDAYHFKIQHDMGSKWSLYVKTLVMELSQDILGKKADIKTIGNTISLTFPK
jgi:hypothetical protein